MGLQGLRPAVSSPRRAPSPMDANHQGAYGTWRHAWPRDTFSIFILLLPLLRPTVFARINFDMKEKSTHSVQSPRSPKFDLKHVVVHVIWCHCWGSKLDRSSSKLCFATSWRILRWDKQKLREFTARLALQELLKALLPETETYKALSKMTNIIYLSMIPLRDQTVLFIIIFLFLAWCLAHK